MDTNVAGPASGKPFGAYKTLLDVVGKVLIGVLTAAILGLFVQVQDASKELVMLRGDLALIAQTAGSSVTRVDEKLAEVRLTTTQIMTDIAELALRVTDLELDVAKRNASREAMERSPL